MVRENAMKLFSACMERVLWKHRRKMWKKVHNVLLTLYLRMSEENPSVAKVSGAHGVGGGSRQGRRQAARSRRQFPASAAPQAAQEALMAGSELLWWDELQEVAHMNQTWRIRACLVRAASALRLEGGWPGGKERGRGRLTEPRGLSSFSRTENGWRSVCRGAGPTCRTPRRRCARRLSDSSVSCPPPVPPCPQNGPGASPCPPWGGG